MSNKNQDAEGDANRIGIKLMDRACCLNRAEERCGCSGWQQRRMITVVRAHVRVAKPIYLTRSKMSLKMGC